MLGASCFLIIVGGFAPAAVAACNKAINVSETQQLNYGSIAVANGGGTVTISPGGGLMVPGGFVAMGGANAGTFHVSGTNNCAVAISFTPGTLTGPGAPMTVTNFTTNAGPNPQLDPAGGQLNFSVGADLRVNAGQAGGNYVGTYAVTVIYN